MNLKSLLVLAVGLMTLPLLLGGCPPSGGGLGDPTGSCCAADGSCSVTTQAACAGTWTSGGVCSPNPCSVPVTPQLFIANFTGNSILSFLNPATVNGNQAPSTNISGPQTSLVNPSSLVVTANGLLLALNFSAIPSSINTYAAATTANGNVVPSRNVQGANTGLLAPSAMALARANDLLFVANNAGTFDINVFTGASTAGFLGNLPPARTIKSAALKNPLGLSITASDELYVANAGNNNVLVFSGASGLNGSVSPSRTLSNAAFTGLFDCFVDAGDRLYVVSGSGGGINKNKVFVINGASTKNGAVTIDSTLTVTGAVALGGIAVDRNQTGYIVEGGGAGAVYVYDAINTRNGTFAADRTITGATTQLSGPIRLFLLE